MDADKREGSGSQKEERGVAEALRSAVERTLAATVGPATTTRERAAGLLDDVVRRGREAGDELARRGQSAGSRLARGGPAGRDELLLRLEALEARLARVEARLRSGGRAGAPESPEGEATEGFSNPEVEG